MIYDDESYDETETVVVGMMKAMEIGAITFIVLLLTLIIATVWIILT